VHDGHRTWRHSKGPSLHHDGTVIVCADRCKAAFLWFMDGVGTHRSGVYRPWDVVYRGCLIQQKNIRGRYIWVCMGLASTQNTDIFLRLQGLSIGSGGQISTKHLKTSIRPFFATCRLPQNPEFWRCYRPRHTFLGPHWK
jgi:hypothetical protein